MPWAMIYDPVVTPREIEVVKLVAIGYSNKEIAQHLHLSIETVKTHLKKLSLKLHARNRTHCVTILMDRGLI